MKNFDETRIIIAADHAGAALMNQLIDILPYNINKPSIDQDIKHPKSYSEIAHEAMDFCINASGFGESLFCILVCGSGIGMSIAANRHQGVRAALCHNPEYASLARRHNNANVLVLGARMITLADALNIIETFIMTPFEGGRHEKRIALIDAVD